MWNGNELKGIYVSWCIYVCGCVSNMRIYDLSHASLVFEIMLFKRAGKITGLMRRVRLVVVQSQRKAKFNPGGPER